MSNGSTKLPRRTERADIPHEHRFRIDSVFVDESARIKEWLAQRANEELGAFGVNPGDHASEVMRRSGEIVSEVGLVYGVDGPQRIIPAVLNDARSGTLQTYVPSRALVTGASVWVGVALLGEVTIGVLQVVLSDAGLGVVLQAILLALTSMIAGVGASGLLKGGLARALPAAWKAMPPQGDDRVRHAVTLAISLAAVIGLIVIRCYGLEGEERFVVAALSTCLAALVIGCEALRGYYGEKYDRLWGRMFDAQVWEADERHRQARPFYEDHFRAQVDALVKGKGVVRGTGNLVAAE